MRIGVLRSCRRSSLQPAPDLHFDLDRYEQGGADHYAIYRSLWRSRSPTEPVLSLIHVILPHRFGGIHFLTRVPDRGRSLHLRACRLRSVSGDPVGMFGKPVQPHTDKPDGHHSDGCRRLDDSGNACSGPHAAQGAGCLAQQPVPAPLTGKRQQCRRPSPSGIGRARFRPETLGFPLSWIYHAAGLLALQWMPTGHPLHLLSPSLICFSISISAKKAVPMATINAPSISGTGLVPSTTCKGGR